MAVREAGQVVDDFEVRLEAGLGDFFWVQLKIVDATYTVEDFELQLGIVAQVPAHFEQVCRFHDHVGIDGVSFLVLDAAAELGFQETAMISVATSK